MENTTRLASSKATTTSINDASLSLLASNELASTLWVGIGTAGSILSVLVMLVCLRNNRKLLAMPHYANVFCLGIADFINCFSHTVMNARVVAMSKAGIPDVTPQYLCAIKGCYFTFAINVISGQTLAMAITRIGFLVLPIQFRIIEPKRLLLLNAFFYAFSIGEGFIVAAGLKQQELVPLCLFSLTFETWATTLTTTITQTFGGVAAACAVLIAALLVWRHKFKSVHDKHQSAAGLSIELTAARSSILVSLRLALFWVVPSIVTRAAILADATNLATKVQPMANAVMGLSSVINFFMYFATDTLFRKELFALFRGGFGKSPTVSPLNSNQS